MFNANPNAVIQDIPTERTTSMSKPFLLLPLILLLGFPLAAVADEGGLVDLTRIPLEPISIHEDFEQIDPVQFWITRGDFKVRFKGLTEKNPHGGKRCFKLDVEFESDGEVVLRVPLAVPLEGSVTQSVQFRAGAGSDADSIHMGYSIFSAPTDHPSYRRTNCGIQGKTLNGEGTDWLQCGERFMTPGHPHDPIVTETRGGPIGISVVGVGKYDIGVTMDPLIWIKGRAGQRAVVYVDDLRIDGTTPNPADYHAAVRARHAAVAAPLHASFRDWENRLQSALAEIEAIGDQPDPLKPCKEAIERGARSQLVEVGHLIRDGFGPLQKIDRVMDTVWGIENSLEGLRRLAELGEVPDLVHYRVRPTANTPVSPLGAPAVAGLDAPLEVAACPGEVEPASFAVYAIKALQGLTLEVSELREAQGSIAAAAIDPFVVKAWYVSGFYQGDPHGRFLVPDLLLKDDALVRVDYENQDNYLRSSPPDGAEEYRLCSGPSSENLAGVLPRDAGTLQRVDVPAGRTQAFWLTVRVPPDAPAGRYSGTVTLRWGGAGRSAVIPLTLTVHPFGLPRSPITYSTYNRGRVSGEIEKQPFHSEYLTVEAYEREIRNQVDHGILYPNSYDGFSKLRQALEARQRAGVATDRFFCVDLSYLMRESSAGTEGMLEKLKETIPQWQAILAEFGYEELWVMGVDEARGAKLKAQRPVIEEIHNLDAKVWAAATHQSAFGVVGDLMDAAVMAGFPKPSETAKWHSTGKEIFVYGAPQSDLDQPEVFRRNFGLAVWQAGYDGAMHYAYRHGFNHVWNDFDHERRDHAFVYPTVDGLVDTLAWEGVREGIDDVRYVTALEAAIAESKDGQLRSEAQAFLDALSIWRNTDAIRAEIVEWILRFR
jgi:hypothetical protein